MAGIAGAIVASAAHEGNCDDLAQRAGIGRARGTMRLD
jgi:hypothetical protein